MRDELDIPMPRMAPAEPGYRVPRQSIDSGTKRLAMIGGGIAGVLLLIGGAWSLSGHHTTGVPLVRADNRPLRTKPANAGGMQVDDQNDAILSGDTAGQDSMAPPPETPAPQALKDQAAQQLAARQQAAAAPPAPKAAPDTAPPAQPVSASTAAPPAPPPQIAAIPEQPEAPARPARPAPADSAPLSDLGGHAAVQLAAMDSEQLALLEWRRLSHKMPGLLDGRHPSVLRAESHGRTYYRLRTGGFADIAQATAFCQEVRAKGGGCALARF